MLAGAAAGVEYCPAEKAGVSEADKGSLRAADVPRRRRSGVGVIPVMWGVSRGHVCNFRARSPVTEQRTSRPGFGSASLNQRQEAEPLSRGRSRPMCSLPVRVAAARPAQEKAVCGLFGFSEHPPSRLLPILYNVEIVKARRSLGQGHHSPGE